MSSLWVEVIDPDTWDLIDERSFPTRKAGLDFVARVWSDFLASIPEDKARERMADIGPCVNIDGVPQGANALILEWDDK